MGNDYSVYMNDGGAMPQNVCVIFIEAGLFYGINLPKEIISNIENLYKDIWKKPLQKIKYYNEKLTNFSPHKPIMYQGTDSANSAKAKQMFCRFHKLFCTYGWSLVNSPTLTFEGSLSSWFYYKEINPNMIDTGTLDNAFCAISLSSYEKLQFIDFPQNLESRMIECLKNNWTKGIHKKEIIEKTENAWSIELDGMPWMCSGESSIEARFLILSVIRFMSHRNWRLVNSTAMKPNASDTMFFRKFSKAFNEEFPDTMPEYYFMLALMGTNYFSVLGVSEDIKNAIATSCERHEEKGIQPIEIKKNYPAIVMNSEVWHRKNEDEFLTKRLMTLLFQDLASIGWLPIESIDCTRSIRDLSSIVFLRIPPVRMMFFSLSPKKYSGICLVNATDDVKALIYDVFLHHYPIKKEEVRQSTYGIASTIECSGDPFTGWNTLSILLFQQTLAVVISALKDAGWMLVLSADTSDETKTKSSGNSSKTVKYSIYSLWFGKILL